jgi:hypothetical protein
VDPRNAKIVFISSTCDELIDLRPELSKFLGENGFQVIASDDPESAFEAKPTQHSIVSCLANVASADVVVCIIDRHYGPPLLDGPYKGLSATHAEVRHARSFDPPKPIFFFIRDRALRDHELIHQNTPDTKTLWVESVEADARRRWYEFVTEVKQFPSHRSESSWYDPFKTSVDLKGLVLKRLSDQFPNYRASLALKPDRLVRLYFVYKRTHSDTNNCINIEGGFRNIGVGPALKIRHGWCRGNQEEEVRHVAALPVLDYLTRSGTPEVCYRGEPGITSLFCEYCNIHNDLYRVEVPAQWLDLGFRISEEDRFFVGHRDGENVKWVRVD